MVTERLTEEEVAARLWEVLDLVSRSGRFTIESDGEVITENVPLGNKPSGDLRKLVAELALLPPLEAGFWADIEEARETLAGEDKRRTAMTWGEFLTTYHERSRPNDRFADDLEANLTEREMLKERREPHGNDNHDD